jgi:hypothetical protein
VAKFRTAVGVVVLLLLLVVAGWVIVKAADQEPAVVAAAIAALGAVGVGVLQRRWEKSEEAARLHRDEMAPIYEDLVDRLKDLEKIAAQGQVEDFFKELTTKLLVHGSPQVIRAWLVWQRCGQQRNEDDLRLLVAYERVLRSIRADLGHDDSSLAPGDLLRIYVTDLDESLSKWQASAAELDAG